MAEIYRAKTVGIAGFEKILALKRISPQYAREPRFIRSFVDEARIAVTLNHRNIVQVFDFGKAEGELYLAMELIEGIDLRSAIQHAAERDVPLPISLACYILSDVASGLDYAHRKADAQGRPLHIAHCDISPHNVMLSYEGFVKILDFGVARAEFVSAPRWTPKARRLRGKPRYMAPEQTRGDDPSAATDVFALGILCWELLTGLPLFEGEDVQEILASVRRAEAPQVVSLNPDVPRYLSDAITRALDREPTQRGTAADLMTALGRAARELARVASSRALADWLDAIEPRGGFAISSTTTNEFLAAGGDPDATATTTVSLIIDPDTGDTDDTYDSDSYPGAIDSAIEEALAETTDPAADQPVDTDVLLERRRVVVSAVLIDGGEPETRRMLGRILADLAYKRGAVIHGHSDDSLVAVFGLQQAGEDDIASAMHYALDATELARSSAASTDRRCAGLAVRIATRAGIVAQRRKDQLRLRGGAISDARALAREAEANRPLLTGGTSRLASAEFAFRELPTWRHGSRRLRVLELLGRRDFDERARALMRRRGRFVGRTAELDRLLDAMERARRDNCRLTVLVTGRAGIGKSRLVAEFAARLQDAPDPPMRVAVSASPSAHDQPFSLITQLFQAALNLPPRRGESARARLVQRLRRTLEESDLESTEVDECIGAIEYAMELRDGALISNVEETADVRDRVAVAVRTFQREYGLGRPLLTVIENLHAADRASADVLRNVLAGPASPGAELVIVTSEPLPTGSSPLADVEDHIELDELPELERRELIAERLGDHAAEQAIAAVARRTGGTPLFIEEIATAVRERGVQEIPSSARDVIVSRIDLLPSSTKAVLQYAAVVGHSFRTAILGELVGPRVHDHVRALAEDGLLQRTDDASVEALEGELSFRNGLIQEVVYEMIATGARRRTHAQLGRLLALRADSGHDEPPALVARHLELGALPQEAAVYWLRAGKVALAAFDAAAARDAFTRVLELDAEHTRKAPNSDDVMSRRREALLGRERAYRELGEHDAEARDLGELEKLAGKNQALMADVKNRAAIRFLRLGQYDDAVRASEDAETAASAAADELSLGEALRLRGEAFERTARFDDGLIAVNQAIEIFERLGEDAAQTRAMIGLGRNHLMRSRYEAAQQAYVPVLERLAQRPDPWLERVAHNHVAVIHLCLGEFEDAMESVERSLRICQRYGDLARVGDNLSVSGLILTEVGQFVPARGRFERALRLHQDTGSRWSRADCLVYAGTCEAYLGDFDRAFTFLEESLSVARDIGARYIEANAGIALAGAYLSRSRKGDSERALSAASAAAHIAQDATLIGAEVQSLSRTAAAMRRTGDEAGALAESTRAVALLAQQKYVEGSEEEVVFTHYRLLVDNNDSNAAEFLRRARDGFERKLGRLTKPEWRESFREAIPLHVEIAEAR